jgi:hypothetical protein
MTYREQMVGMADALVGQKLRTRGSKRAAEPFASTSLEVELLRMADAAIAAKIPLAIVFPLHAPEAAMVLAATSVVGAVLEHRGLDVQVGVAAKNVANVAYDNLCLLDLQLADFVSRTRVLADSTVKVVREAKAGQGRVHLTGEVDRLLPLMPALNAVLVDQSGTTPAGLGALLDQNAPLLYLTRSPLDPNLELLRRHGGLVWAAGLGPTDRSGRPALMVSSPLLSAASTAQISIAAPGANGYDDALTELCQALKALLTASNEPHRLSRLARRARDQVLQWVWSLFYVAGTSPIDAARYDEVARTNPYAPPSRLGEAPAVCREFARAADGTQREAWYRVANAFADLLTRPTPKFPALLRWVTDHVTAEQPGTIVVQNQSIAIAVGAAIAESPKVFDGWERVVHVVTFGQLPALAATTPSDLCLTGAPSRRHAGIFAMPPGTSLTVIAAGPAEAARVRRMIVDSRRTHQELRRQTIEVTAPRLGVEPLIEFRPIDPEIGLIGYEPEIDATGNDSWEPFSANLDQSIFDVLTQVTTEGTATPWFGGEPGTVDAVAVHLADEHLVLLDANSMVTRRRRDHLARVAAKSIEPGDVLLLVDQDAHGDLFGSVLNRLATTTAYSTLLVLIGFWHERVGAARAGSRTYAEILDLMGDTSITSEATIGAWIRGDVGGPADKADIERVAKAIDDEVLAAKAQQVGWALTTLHRIHRKLGRWLAAQIDDATVAPADATVDAALGVHVADLLDAVSLWPVTAVEEDRFTVSSAVIGTLLPVTDLDDPFLHRRSA